MAPRLTAAERIAARGWRPAHNRWWHPDHQKDERQRAGNLLEDALVQCEREDAAEAHEHGSVTYRPTAEQAQTSALLAACAAQGMTERDVIEQQHRRIDDQAAMIRQLEGAAAQLWGRLRAIARTGFWGTCVDCPQLGTEIHPEHCKYAGRADHRLTVKDLL